MQALKSFYCGAWPGKDLNTIPVEDQVNEFLKSHPDHKITEMTALLGPSYKELFVTFDIFNKSQKQEVKVNKKETIKNGT